MVHVRLESIAKESPQLSSGDVRSRSKKHFELLPLTPIPRHLDSGVLGCPVLSDDILGLDMATGGNVGLGWFLGIARFRLWLLRPHFLCARRFLFCSALFWSGLVRFILRFIAFLKRFIAFQCLFCAEFVNSISARVGNKLTFTPVQNFPIFIDKTLR